MIAFILAAACILPRDLCIRESVCLVEVNHFYDEHARLVFDQVIFYDWSHGDARYMVRAWRLVKNHNQLPQRDWENGGYVALWQDGEVLRQVRAPHVRESWSQSDPELIEREYLPKELRRELKQSREPRTNATR